MAGSEQITVQTLRSAPYPLIDNKSPPFLIVCKSGFTVDIYEWGLTGTSYSEIGSLGRLYPTIR
jgi:hypothetical protein